MLLYAGMDLHGDNVFCSVMDEKFSIVFEQRFPNVLKTILGGLAPFRERLAAVVVESTYNWYWLVDGLLEHKYPAMLANPALMQTNIGLKDANDKTDARFIAKQAAMGVLPRSFIYPRDLRPTRDLLRRRLCYVHARTAEWLRLESLVARHTGKDLGMRAIGELDTAAIKELLGSDVVVAMAQMSLDHIEFLSAKIKTIEQSVEAGLELCDNYPRLLTVPGIGRILAMTIALETGPINRFPGPGNYASYCRAVKTTHTSNEKKKGDGNSKCGNRYLAWAYVEAANFAVRYSPELRAWYQRKAASTNRTVAIKALSNKMSKACFFIMRDGVDFDVKKLVG